MDPKETIKTIEGEIDNLLSMYSLAEKTYPYSKLHGDRSENENQQRRNTMKYTTETPEQLILQGSSMSFMFVYMMSRQGAKGLFDMSQVFNRPARAFGWFLLGNSILAFWRVNYAGQIHQNNS